MHASSRMIRGRGAIALLLVMLTMGCTSAEFVLEPTRPTLPQALLWQGTYPGILLDIDHAPERGPLPSTVDALVQTLRAVTGKEGVTVLGPTEIEGHVPSAERVWTRDELIALERATNDHRLAPGIYGAGENVVLHILFLDGGYRDVQGVQGVGAQNAMYLFQDSVGRRDHDIVDEYDLPEGPNHLEAERHVAVHELGHALGLVNCGVPMVTPRQTPDGECHSTNGHSPMAVARDVPGDVQHRLLYGDWAPWRFDEDDLADLETFRRSEP